MNTRTVTFSLQALITNAGGFDAEVKQGVGVITVSGADPEGVSLFNFIQNSRESASTISTYSFPPLEEVPNDQVPSS